MKKFKTIFLGLCAVLLFTAVSCSRNSDDEGQAQTDNSLKLEGTWALEKVDFQGDGVNWKEGVPYNAGTSFAYAPFMFKDVQGFKFGNKKVTGDLGYRFDYVYGVNHGENPADETWYWNYLNNDTFFEIQQINPAYPPYNFSITGVSKINKLDNGNTLVVSAEVNSRVPGTPITNTIKVPVILTMKKGTPTTETTLYQNGAPYVFPN